MRKSLMEDRVSLAGLETMLQKPLCQRGKSGVLFLAAHEAPLPVLPLPNSPFQEAECDDTGLSHVL